MHDCQQTKGMSVYEHGLSVNEYLNDLLNHLRTDEPLKKEWKMPQWIYDNKDLILENLFDQQTLDLYTIYHDCGKPFCREVDDEGKVHFPNHAEISYEVFKSLFDNDDAANLIKSDMMIHTLKSEQLEEFSKSKYAITLMLTGLAEIHSNCAMFGGVDSTSFKIKWKHIDKRGRQVINLIKTNKTKTT